LQSPSSPAHLTTEYLTPHYIPGNTSLTEGFGVQSTPVKEVTPLSGLHECSTPPSIIDDDQESLGPSDDESTRGLFDMDFKVQ
jgi:hypothetical protein